MTQKNYKKHMNNYNRDIILVNEHDEIIGADKCLNAHHVDSLMLHRAFSVFLFDSSNRLLIQKRSKKKLVYPLMWGNTVCSHPFLNTLSFEDPVLDAKNHILERLDYELGINEVKNEDLIFLGRILYKAVGEKFSGKLLKGKPQKQEIKSFESPNVLRLEIDSSMFGEYEVDYVFIIKKDVNIRINENEVEEYKYITKEELEDFVKGPDVGIWLKVILKYNDVFI